MDKFIERVFQEVLYAVCWPARKVYVRARRPYPPDSAGCISMTHNRIIVIDIHPALDMEGAYRTFLHEMGHCVLGHGEKLLPSDWAYRLPGSGPNELTTPELVEAHKKLPDELAADNFVKVTDERITAKRDQLFKPGTGPLIYQKYYILQHYPLEVLS